MHIEVKTRMNILQIHFHSIPTFRHISTNSPVHNEKTMFSVVVFVVVLLLLVVSFDVVLLLVVSFDIIAVGLADMYLFDSSYLRAFSPCPFFPHSLLVFFVELEGQKLL